VGFRLNIVHLTCEMYSPQTATYTTYGNHYGSCKLFIVTPIDASFHSLECKYCMHTCTSF